jgi:putative thioredoxin
MAGAVDLSALKQSAPSSGDAAAGESAPIGIEINEANFEQQVLLRSNEVPVVVLLWSPRSDVCLQLADILSGLAAADNGKWSLASVPDLRCRSGPDRRGFGGGTATFELPGHAAA